MNLGLEGRKVVVAGGTRGIGRASAEAFAAEGARVAVLARSVIDLRETEAALLEAGALEAIGLECDLFDTGEVEAAFSFVEDQWSELHVLVNAAGPSHLGTFDELTDGEWLDAFDAGVLMTVRAVRAALPLIRQASFGRIINLTASSIRHQSAGLAAYTAAKAALASASKNMARSLAKEGILVNTVAPGTVMSPAIEAYLQTTDLSGLPEGPLEAAYAALERDFGSPNDIGRVGLPEEVAALVVFLGSEQASYLVGATIAIDGGSDFS